MSESSLGLYEWPEQYGFWIYGNGPTFVIDVEPTSISAKAGIRVGDCIVELDNQDVTKDSATTLRTIAQKAKKKPPPISVKGVTKLFKMKPQRNLKNSSFLSTYGFSIKGESPVLIDHVIVSSVAYRAGLRQGDAIVKINNITIKDQKTLVAVLSEINSDTVEMKYVSLNGTVVNPLVKSLPNKLTEFSNIKTCSQARIVNSNYNKFDSPDDLQQKQEFNAMVTYILINIIYQVILKKD